MTVLIYEPKPQPIGYLFIILGITGPENRFTMPRVAPLGAVSTAGFKKVIHTVTCQVTTADAQEDVSQERLDDMIQSMLYQLRNAALPHSMTDTVAVPNETSSVVEVGEDINILDNWTEMLNPEAQEGWVQSSAIIEIILHELVQS